MKIIIAVVALLLGVSVAPAQTAHADLTSCVNVTQFVNNLAAGAVSQCGVQDSNTTYPLNQQRTRIKCLLISNMNTWTTKNGAWVGRAYFSTAMCPSGYIMSEKTIQKR